MVNVHVRNIRGLLSSTVNSLNSTNIMETHLQKIIEPLTTSVRRSDCSSVRYQKKQDTNSSTSISDPMLLRFHLVIQGTLSLVGPCAAHEICVQAGDVVLVINSKNHSLREIEKYNSATSTGQSRTRSLLVEMSIENNYRSELLKLFPTVLIIRQREMSAPDWVQTFGRLVEIELDSGEQSLIIVDRFVEVLLQEFVRSSIRSGYIDVSFIDAIGDKKLFKLLRVLHESPEEHWTVSSMASIAAMSRSSFADRFSTVIGQTPQQYLLNVRIKKACELIHRDKLPIGKVAEEVGYRSKAAFTRAFCRVVGVTPIAFRTRSSVSYLEQLATAPIAPSLVESPTARKVVQRGESSRNTKPSAFN